MKKSQAYRQYISAIIRKLPQDQQLVLSLYYCDQLNFHEIGRVLDISASEAARLYVKGASACLATGKYSKFRLLSP